jgi:hypothetical protein
MSIRLMTLIWDIEFPTQSQLLIALKLADHANDEGSSIWPSRSRMASLTQCSESTVKNVLRAFRDVGLLHVVEEGGHGPRDTTKYAFHMRLLSALHSDVCKLVGNSEKLELEWEEKGSEFDPLKGLEFDPLDGARGQPLPVRGQPAVAKGSASYPQIITNHQIETSGAGERANADARASTALEKPRRLVLAEDAEWQAWLTFAEKRFDRNYAEAFVREGAMVVFDEYPSSTADIPKLPPQRSDRYDELLEQRKVRGLTQVSLRMTGETA